MAPDPRDLVDLSGLHHRTEAADPNPPAAARPFLQVFFRCANYYQRVYRSADGTAYNARCPRCAKPVRFKVGEGGSDSRRFEVNCGI